tara:strand:- start:2018 stop:2797 length:780 start_codon:yes stop_codon:yes gene_type:complete
MAIDPLTAVKIGTTLFSFFSGNKAKKQAQKSQQLAAEQAAAQLALQKEQMALLEAQRERYRQFEFTNPYADLENPYEDITVNQETAKFQMEQAAQQRANIMQGLRGAAGSSGIASLAQALANQGTLQAQRVSADLSKQEALNQRLIAQGASATEMAFRGGEQMVQEAEMRRQATLLGVAYQGAAGAASGVQQAFANQMSSGMAAAQMGMQQASMFANLGQSIGELDLNFGGGGGGSTQSNNPNTDQLLSFLNSYGSTLE